MNTFGERLDAILLRSTEASGISSIVPVQELWSGYGQIARVSLSGSDKKTIIIKHVQPPTGSDHPRGWNTNISHERKVKSYEVETAWYQNWSDQCGSQCRVPECYASERIGEEIFLVLEDLNDSGFPARLSSLSWPQIENCLRWLANFHAVFMNKEPTGLWDIGTYWHLDTRPDELAALDDAPLKSAATAIDARLNAAIYKTFVHGDAKLANFCFSEGGDKVAAVDFQYVGGGCGMKDVAYFIGSCLDEDACERQEAKLLDTYFEALIEALALRQPDIEAEKVVTEWRELFPFAWADFHRFLKGWCPGHWKINGYSERIMRKVVAATRE